MELKEEMYARTRLGIGKVITVGENDAEVDFSNDSIVLPIADTNFLKSSYDITDLIEKDDIIKHPVLGIRGITNINVERKEIGVEGMICCIPFEDFKQAFELGAIRILTKEQFKVAYKVGN